MGDQRRAIAGRVAGAEGHVDPDLAVSPHPAGDRPSRFVAERHLHADALVGGAQRAHAAQAVLALAHVQPATGHDRAVLAAAQVGDHPAQTQEALTGLGLRAQARPDRVDRRRRDADVDADDLPQQRREALGVALGIVLRAAVPGGQVEHPVPAEQELAAVVVLGLVVLDRQDRAARGQVAAVGAGGAATELVELKVVRLVGVVGEHAAAGRVVGREREREQALLAVGGRDQRAQVEEVAHLGAGAQLDDAGLLDDEEPVGLACRRGHGERLIEAADASGDEVGAVLGEPVDRAGQGRGVEVADAVLAECRQRRDVRLLRRAAIRLQLVDAGVESAEQIAPGECGQVRIAHHVAADHDVRSARVGVHGRVVVGRRAARLHQCGFEVHSSLESLPFRPGKDH